MNTWQGMVCCAVDIELLYDSSCSHAKLDEKAIPITFVYNCLAWISLTKGDN